MVGLSLLTLFLSNSEREKGVQTCRSIPNVKRINRKSEVNFCDESATLDISYERV